MRIDGTFLRSRLSRRIFALFVLCALIPITLLAAISLWNVDHQLRAQSREELRQESHEQGMYLVERLSFLEADLKLVAPVPDEGRSALFADGISASAERRLAGLEWVSDDGSRRTVFGEMSSQVVPSQAEEEFLASGKSVLATRPCRVSSVCVFLLRQAKRSKRSGGTLIAEILPAYLLSAENILESRDVCLADQQGRVVACSGEIPRQLPPEIFRAVTGQSAWRQNGTEYQADFWNVFLKPNFFTDHWTVLASESSDDVLAPLAHFKKIFVLVVLLALWIVLLFSLIQIRRSLLPLSELEHGTKCIAKGEMDSRVNVASGDEFEDLGRSFNSMAGRLERQFHALQARNAVDRAILSSWDSERIVAALLAHLGLVFPCKLACVNVVDSRTPDRTRMYLGPAVDGGAIGGQLMAVPDAEIQELTFHPNITVVPIDGRVPEFLSPLASRGMRTCLVAPILIGGKLAAIISLGRQEDSIWTEEDLVQARQIADQVAVAFSNAQLVTDLRDLNVGTLTALARAIDAKSPWTAGHSERVTEMALKIGREMQLAQKDLDILHRGGLLHDIGKIGVSLDLLDKPGKLTDDEMKKVRDHIEIGKRILEPIASFAECMPVVLQHHEWFDGSGYPAGLAGEKISIHARIFAVADCYDALVSDRPYRPGLPIERVVYVLRQGAGRQFDPGVMEAFLRVIAREKNYKERGAVAVSPFPAKERFFDFLVSLR